MARKYKKDSCHNTKAAAKKKQKSMHTAGQTARLVEDKANKKWCVETAGKKLIAKKKKK